MRVERIEDLADPRVRIYRNVRDAALRDDRDLFLAESRLCVERLLALRRHRVHSVLLSEAALAALEPALRASGAAFPVYLARPELLQRVVGYPLHRGCIAAAHRGALPTLEALLRAKPRLLVGLEGVANPENVGNVFRNALAFGADAVVLSRDCADPLYRKAIRVSMAASLRTPFARIRSWPEAIGALRSAGLRVFALTPAHGERDLDALPAEVLSQPALWLLGAEGDGLRDATRAAADCAVRIRLAEGVDSLNVAAASAVALQRVFARRAQRRPIPPPSAE